MIADAHSGPDVGLTRTVNACPHSVVRRAVGTPPPTPPPPTGRRAKLVVLGPWSAVLRTYVCCAEPAGRVTLCCLGTGGRTHACRADRRGLGRHNRAPCVSSSPGSGAGTLVEFAPSRTSLLEDQWQFAS